jgi:hypothetical protein
MGLERQRTWVKKARPEVITDREFNCEAGERYATQGCNAQVYSDAA